MGFKELLQQYPGKRLKAQDGLAITAEVWEEAHAHHQRTARFHNLLQHGWGIITGLDVIASDPADSSVFISPGIAIDPQGQTIILPQPVSYDIGNEISGQIFLVLSYEESRPRQERGDKTDAQQKENTPLYVQAQFSITAPDSVPQFAHVELARIDRSSQTSPIHNAEDPAQPAQDEIDLRYRRGMRSAQDLSIAVSYLGSIDEKLHGLGAGRLAHSLNHLTPGHITVNNDVPLAPGIEENQLIYLVGQGKFKLSTGQLNGLGNYMRRAGGTIFIEYMDAKAKVAFLDGLTALQIEPEPVQAGHRLLTDPHLFNAPPPGYNSETPEVLFSAGLILSGGNYGLLWNGKSATGVPDRERLRSAIEWGQNLLSYAGSRYRFIVR